MKIGQQFKFFVINHPASSLYSLIADSKYRATSLGRNAWKKLIGSKASLQRNYNKEGFNVVGIHKAWDPFLENPGNVSGPKSNFQIEV